MDAIIQVMELTIAARDPYTVGHQQRATQLACAIGARMDLPEASLRELHVAGRLHDLGKIAIPGEILSKSGQLTPAEFSLIKTHPQVGYDILQPLKLPGQICQIVLQHHERLNGSGYPQGLKGREILLGAKILAVADVVEAMGSHRPYRPALDLDQALAEIARLKGTLYDAAVVDACLMVYEEDWADRPVAANETAYRPARVYHLPPSRTKGSPDRETGSSKARGFSPRRGLLSLKSRFYLHAAATSMAAGMMMMAIRGA